MKRVIRFPVPPATYPPARGHHPNSRLALETSRCPEKARAAFAARPREGKIVCSLARTWALVGLLSATSEGLTVGEIVTETGVSRRLVYRDLVTLKASGFNVVAEWDTDHHRRYRVTQKDADGHLSRTVAKTIRVLQALEQAGTIGRTLEQLAAATEIPRSLAMRLIHVLESAGVPIYEHSIVDSTGAQQTRWSVLMNGVRPRTGSG